MTQNDKCIVNTDLINGIIPKRVPISAKIPFEACVEYQNLPLAETHWNLKGIKSAYETICQFIQSDSIPIGGEEKNPAVFRLLDSQGYSMTSTGSMQHYDVITLHENEYPELIDKPLDFILETIMPRMFHALSAPATKRAFILAQAYNAYTQHNSIISKVTRDLKEKYGFYSPPVGSVSIVRAPFDLISDFFRGFKGISTDIKRCPGFLKDATQAILPFQILRGTPTNISKEGFTFMPLHFATYLREKDFRELYWPSLEAFVNKMAEKGQTCQLFCEGDWMRYIDYLYELPTGTRFKFEYGDPKKIKTVLGKKHIISGLYPLTYLKTATKQECIDKAKELLDILAPGGNYVFAFDKDPLSLNSINIDNYAAVVDYISNNAYYDNAGQISNKKFKDSKEFKKFNIPELNSQYHNICQSIPELDGNFSNIVDEKFLNYEKDLLAMLCRNL